MRRVFAIALPAVLAAAPVAAQPAPAGAGMPTADSTPPPGGGATVPLSMVDGNFLSQAAGANQAEAAIGRIAADHAHADAVRDFAARVVADHASLAQQAQLLAQQQGIQVPSAFSQQQQGAAARLAAQSGDGFDRAYLAEEVQSHQQAVGLFQAEADHGTDPAVKRFAQDALPVLRAHLDRARQLQR